VNKESIVMRTGVKTKTKDGGANLSKQSPWSLF